MPREFNGNLVFDAYFVRPTKDPHEVFFHLMEAMVVTLQHSRGPPPVCTPDTSLTVFFNPLDPEALRLAVCEADGTPVTSFKKSTVAKHISSASH